MGRKKKYIVMMFEGVDRYEKKKMPFVLLTKSLMLTAHTQHSRRDELNTGNRTSHSSRAASIMCETT